MIKGTTTTGFEFEVDDDVLYDAEFLELYVKIKRGDDGGEMIFDLAENMLGKEQKKRLYDHVRGEGKRVNIEQFAYNVRDIIECLENEEKTKN